MKFSNLFLFGIVCSASLNVNAVTKQKPNILIFLVDDLGWTDVACFGSKYYETPAVDELAREGVKFTNAYAACTVSSPTRASIMTGKYPARLHVTDWISGWDYMYAKLMPPIWTMHLKLEEETIAERLKKEGYHTWALGKWHIGDEPKYWPLNQGFEVNLGGCDRGSPNKDKKLGYKGYFVPYGLPTLKDGPKGEYLTDRLTQEAIKLIENQKDDKPFFMYLAHYAVHGPLDGKKNLIEKYKRLKKSDYSQKNEVFAAMVESMDQSLGNIIEVLKKEKKLDNTIIFFASDNGSVDKTSKSLPLRGGKGSMYEGGVRTPFIIRYPGSKLKAGSVSTLPVITMDITATALDLAGVKISKKDIDGRSLLGELEGKKGKVKPIFWHYPHYHPGGAVPYSAVRFGDYKLIHNYETNKDELYNLITDISEKKDLSETNKKESKKLRKILDKWLKKINAQLPLKNPNYDEIKKDKHISFKKLWEKEG